MDIISAKYVTEDNSLVDVQVDHPTLGIIAYTFHIDTEDTGLDSLVREALVDLVPEPYVDDTDYVAEAAAITTAEIARLDAEMVAQADTLLTCLINKGVLDGTEPEIQVLLSKKARKEVLREAQRNTV